MLLGSGSVSWLNTGTVVLVLLHMNRNRSSLKATVTVLFCCSTAWFAVGYQDDSDSRIGP